MAVGAGLNALLAAQGPAFPDSKRGCGGMAVVRLPVVCPVCGSEEVREFDVAVLAAALLKEAGVVLTSACHGERWSASMLEIEQIREYLGSLAPRAD
jgi:hypothetical protein